MKFRLRTLRAGTVGLLAAALVFAGTGPAHAAETPPTPLDRPLLQRIVDDMVGYSGVPGAVAQVVDNQAGKLNFSSGVADRNSGKPITTDMAGRVGGSSMTFVATVTLQLVEERKIQLDAPVERYLPGLIPWGNQITVRQLLYHTSGLADHLQLPRFADKALYLNERWKTFTPAELVRLAVDEGPITTPGEWYFSYTNYIAVGMIIEKVTGHTPQYEVTKRIILPLKLRSTYFPVVLPIIPFKHSQGYFHMDDGSWIDVTELNPSAAGAARGLISTVPDLVTFWRALLAERKLLKPATLRQMLTFISLQVPGPGPGVPDIQVGQGLGIIQITYSCGVTSYGSHGAAMHGFDTTVHVSKDGSRAASAMVNQYTNDETQGPVLVPFLGAVFCSQYSRPI